MSKVNVILDGQAALVRSRMSAEDQKKVEVKHCKAKLELIVRLLMESCTADGEELVKRCTDPGRRELVFVKQAVRAAMVALAQKRSPIRRTFSINF